MEFLFKFCFTVLLTNIIVFKGYSQDIPTTTKLKKSSETTFKVKSIPYIYEFPTEPLLLKAGDSPERAWKVYSDANGNQTFSNQNLHTPLNKINFLDSFYVKNETKDALELIKCVPGLLVNNSLQIVNSQNAVWNGWIEKTKLLLSEKSLLDPLNRRPIKSITMANGFDVIQPLKEGVKLNFLKVFDSPSALIELDKNISFGELVYVYKTSKQRVLIGRRPDFRSNFSTDILIGWVYKDLVQSYGQRLSLELNVQKESKHILYVSKDSSVIKSSVSPQGYVLQEKSCDISKVLEKKSPVFKFETIKKGEEKINVFMTGSVLNVFDKSKGFIYNVLGTKISNSDLCEMKENSKKINIVFAINQISDTKEYMLALNKSLQEISELFEFKNKELNLKFGAVDCNSSDNGTSFKIELSSSYPEIINGVSKMLRKSIEDKSPTPASSFIVNGLVNASKLLKGSEGQSNIIIIVSSQADNASLETANKALKETALNELSKLNGRLLFMQPYCGTNPNYANFVQQAKLLIKASSEKEAVLRRERMVGIEKDNSNLNNFRAILNGPNNIYCLDYPQNANNQGILIFPTIGNKIDEKYFRAGLDTLLCQIVKDNETVINSLSQVFDSPNCFNVKVNPNFQKYYSRVNPLPADLPAILKNVSYQYFAPGYVSYSERAGNRPVKQSLFLSEEEYEETVNMFKELRLDEIGANYDMKTRTASYQAILKVIRRYSDERQVHIQEYTSFADFLEEIVGYRPENNLLKKYKIADLIATNTQIREDMKLLVAHLNNRFTLFYEVNQMIGQGFYSNGMKYYHVPEKFLP